MRRHSCVAGVLSIAVLICSLHLALSEEVTDGMQTEDPEEVTDDDYDGTVEPTTIDSDPCDNIECNNGGTCTYVEGEDKAYCSCPPNYDGDSCDEYDDPCNGTNCNSGNCTAGDDGSAYCQCPDDYEGDYCETPIINDYPTSAAFEIVVAITKINNETAEFEEAYNNPSSSEYQELEQQVCDWMTQAFGTASSAASDCSISNVQSGSLIVTVNIYILSLSDLSTDDIDDLLDQAYEKDPGIFTIDTENISIEKEQLLQCPTCSYVEYSLSDYFPLDFPLYFGDLNCIEGSDISSTGCFAPPSAGRTHQCVAYEWVDLIAEVGAIGRVFGRYCVSATPQNESSLQGSDAVQFSKEDVDKIDGDDNSTFSDGAFIRSHLCNEDDCLTDFDPCPDPRQVKCYGSVKCISLSQFCDQREDCPDGEDEAVVPDGFCPVPPPCSGPNDFKCTNDTDECIIRALVCDGIEDCDNAADEGNCNGTCDRPAAPQNGFIIDAVPVYQNASTITYACNDGYTLVGSEQLCLNGVWDGSAPTCISNCPKPITNDANIVFMFNGTFDNGARYPHSSKIALECKGGFKLDPADDDNAFTCNESNWEKTTGENNPSGFICKNIDECASSDDVCHDNSYCMDSVGSYECICNNGYEEGGEGCSDVNECDDNTPCAENADCINTVGSYSCDCSEGYEGDGYTECTENLFLPYHPNDVYTYDLRRYYNWWTFRWRNEYISWSLWPPSGFPFGKDYFRSFYITADGLIVFQNRYWWWKNSYPYPFGSVLSEFDPEAVVAPFWTKSDFNKGGNVYYQNYYSLWRWPSNYEEVFEAVNSRISKIDNGTYDGFEATWAAVITWEDMPEVTSGSSTDNTNTFQSVLATDGLRSFLFFVYKNNRMKWQALEQKNAIIGFNNPFDAATPKNLHSDLADKYRPDKEIGNMGKQGYWAYRLDDNDLDDVNPRKYCEEWASEQPSITFLRWIVRPCPCSVAQAVADSRYTKCERISENLDGFNEPGEDEGLCFQQVWPRWLYSSGKYYTSGARCSYNTEGALITGYKDVWANSNAQLYHGALGGRWYFSPYATKVDWRDKEVLARYYCCKMSDKCDLYEEHRPPLTCDFYRAIQPGCFYGDPHIVTLDDGTYSFNGLGEYVMVQVDGMDFELQGRTGRAMSNGTIIEGGGTVFVAFAAQMGITTVEFILNDNRTEFITVVNGTDVVNDTMLKEGESYFSEDDSSFTVDYTAPTNISGGRIAARWTTTLPDGNDTDVDFTVSAGVKLAMLDIIVEVPPELSDLGITSGLMGVYNGDNTDDFVFPNGTMLTAAGENLTESEIFEYGETWRTTESSSLFNYSQEGGNWSTYNDLDFVPFFLDELIERYEGTGLLEEAYGVCGMDNRECLFDSLVTNNTEIGGNTKATDEMFQELVSNLDNFPPNISDISEVGSTESLDYANRTVQLVVNETYEYQVTASDPNDDDIMYSLTYDGLGATINQSGVINLAPTSTEEAKFEVAVSDGSANSSISFKVLICSCQNNGTCDWDNTETNGTFGVAPCICTEGWTGDDCSTDLDSCEEDPCYPGVLCQDQPPPEVNATCGSCPTGLMGNGFKCYDFNECADEDANDCDHTCTNTLGSYECSCDDGYELHLDGSRCNDIDECTLNTHNCDNNATCNNTAGAYDCLCNDGYQKVDGVCLDIDECLTYPCANIAKCINYPASYSCQCPDGYYGDGTECTDIDECRGADTNDCHEMATCKNLDGSYQCTCNAGWEGNGVDCSDVNECSRGTSSCHSRANCTNTVGSYKCNCQLGFIGDGEMCTDIDECTKQIDDCVQLCVNTAPGYTCSCEAGFELDTDKVSCKVEDGSVCTDSSKTCGGEKYGQCVSSGGSDVCICNRGAELNDAETCEDIDECTANTHGCDATHGTCTNTQPGYSCSCDTGYELDNDERSCRDIDECSDDSTCHMEATCTNTEGSYSCSCNVGYSGDGQDCTNVNECETESGLCAENADCADTEGSYTCACNDGFQGDGYSTCIDLDECNSVGACDEQATCNNTIGSFTCECNEGYADNGKTCSDIDECTSINSPHNCPDNSRCINNEGSFRCTCNSGFEQSPIVNDVFTCLDVDECEEDFDDCDASADCTNTEGSFLCECQDGYVGDGKICTDIDECSVSIPCSTSDNERCENRIGSHRCICQTNYFRQGDDDTCQASISRTLVVLFSLVKGLDPVLYFDNVNTQDNRDALSEEMRVLFSDVSDDFLGVSVEEIVSEENGAEVTARLDFLATATVVDADVKQAFLDGLGDNMFLGTNSRVVSVNVSEPVIDPCKEGTHDCFDKNFDDCVFVADDEFDCENCKTGYRHDTDADTCTEIRPCEETTNICVEKNFEACVHDGPGEHHCENCTDGFEQEGDMCVVFKILQGQFTMTHIQGDLAVYSNDLANSNSPRFIALASLVCEQITLALNGSSTTLYDCEVLEFQDGSIIAIYAIVLDDNTNPDPDDVLETLKTWLINSTALGVDSTSFEIRDICDGVNCLNGGWCTKDDNFDPICRCTSDYEGDRCETEKVGPSGSKGLTTGQIVGIAVGCSIFVILVVVILVVVICKATKRKNKVSHAQGDDPQEHLGGSVKGRGTPKERKLDENNEEN